MTLQRAVEILEMPKERLKEMSEMPFSQFSEEYDEALAVVLKCARTIMAMAMFEPQNCVEPVMHERQYAEIPDGMMEEINRMCDELLKRAEEANADE